MHEPRVEGAALREKEKDGSHLPAPEEGVALVEEGSHDLEQVRIARYPSLRGPRCR